MGQLGAVFCIGACATAQHLCTSISGTRLFDYVPGNMQLSAVCESD